MKTDLFDFDLPREAIAQHPAVPRDAARLLRVGRGEPGTALEDRTIRDLPGLLREGDLLVFNDTRVLPARLTGNRLKAGVEAGADFGGGRIEVTLHKAEGPLGETPATWRAFARPARRLAAGDRILFQEAFSAEIVEKGEAGEVTLRFDRAGASLRAALESQGVMPLPPYIRREAEGDPADREDYQTLFAREPGAVAAPTAGLHFTPELMAAFRARGVGHCFVTLHVGAGTFLPVKVEEAEEHRMHSERGAITPATAEAVNRTRARGGRVVAVGTTSLRTLEAAAAAQALEAGGELRPFEADIDLFILPGYRFRAIDLLLTNFHLPRSTLFMLVSAFAGLERMQAAYAHAIRKEYRFYSYGDACLLEQAA